MAGSYPGRIRQLPIYDGRFDAHRLTADGADILFAFYPAGTEIAPHVHDTDNYGVIIKGALILTVSGVERSIGLGQWYHVPANAEHSARFEQETDEIEFWFKDSTWSFKARG